MASVPRGQGDSKSADSSEPPLINLPPAEAADDGDDPAPATGTADGAEAEWREARIAPAQHGLRLDLALVALAPEFSRSHLQHLLGEGHAWLDGVPARIASRRVKSGQRLRVQLVPTDESRAYTPQPMALQVVHEDAHLLVLDKPAGLVVHPAAGNWSGTLLNGLLAHHAGAAQLPRAGIVHRLDKDTSGLMLVGKTLPAVTALVRAIAAREVHRRYLAICHGEPAVTRFTVEAPIGRDPQVRVRMAVVPQAAGGRAARTDVEVLARRDGHAALSCTLHTGRTHQIRVHLAHSGHPLVADAVYGGRAALGLQRQALHATELRLQHPVSGEPLAFVQGPPADLAAAWAQLGLRAVR